MGIVERKWGGSMRLFLYCVKFICGDFCEN